MNRKQLLVMLALGSLLSAAPLAAYAQGAGPPGPDREGQMGPGRGGAWRGRDFARQGRPRAGMGGPGMRAAGPFGAFARQLDLTEAQRTKLREIRERQARKGIQARADLEIARLDLRNLIASERPDAGAINAQIDRTARLRADLEKSRVASMLEARSVLTPEQQRKLRELRENGPGRGMGGRMRDGGGREGATPDAQ